MPLVYKTPGLRAEAFKPQKTNGTVKKPSSGRTVAASSGMASNVSSRRLRPAKPAARTVTGTGRWFRRCALAALMSVTLLVAWWSARTWIAGPADLSAPAAISPDVSLSRVVAPGLVEATGGALNLAFEGSGRIVELSVQEGDALKAGQLIARLDSAEAEARLAAAAAALRSAQADLERITVSVDQRIEANAQTKLRLEQAWNQLKGGARVEDLQAQAAVLKAAEVEAERAESNSARNQNAGLVTEQAQFDLRKSAERSRQQVLLERAKMDRIKNGSTAEELRQAEAAYLAAAADYRRELESKPFVLQQAAEQIKQRQAELQIARFELEKTSLRAPSDGVVLWRFLHAGETVSALAPRPVLALADLRRLEIRAEVDEADFPRVVAGQPVEIRCEAYRDKRFTGRVLRLNRSAGQKRFLTGDAGERLDVRVIEAVIQIDTPEAFVVHQRVTVYFGGPAPENASTSVSNHP